jgi:hypothetical protein
MKFTAGIMEMGQRTSNSHERLMKNSLAHVERLPARPFTFQRRVRAEKEGFSQLNL